MERIKTNSAENHNKKLMEAGKWQYPAKAGFAEIAKMQFNLSRLRKAVYKFLGLGIFIAG
jgi:hypothetical protein